MNKRPVPYRAGSKTRQWRFARTGDPSRGRNTLSTQNHAAGIARKFSINVKDSVMKSKFDKVSGGPHSFNDGIMRAGLQLRRCGKGLRIRLSRAQRTSVHIELPSFNVATTMAAKPYTVEVYQRNVPGVLTYDFGKEEVGTADIKAEKWPLMDSTVDALRERLTVITSAPSTPCLPSFNGDAKDFAENGVLTASRYQCVSYRNVESRVYAGAKDDTLPDPESISNPELKCIRQMIKASTPYHATGWTRMTKCCKGVTETQSKFNNVSGCLTRFTTASRARLTS